jgi:hypothetical protein
MDATEARAVADEERARLEGLVSRAMRGDREVLPALRDALDRHPALARQAGDLAARAEDAWLDLLAGQDLFTAEAVRRRLAALRAELAGPQPQPLERLVVDRIAACFLQLQYADVTYAQARDPGASVAALREMQRRQEGAERRYQAALRQLAVIRKLLRPALSPLQVAAGIVAEERAAPKRQTTTASPRLAGVN